MGVVPALQGAVELGGIDAHQYVADDGLAGHGEAPASEAFPGARGQVLGPLGHGLVAAHAAQGGPGGDAQHGGQGMAPSLAAAGVVDVGEKLRQGAHGVGGDHDSGYSVAVDGIERGFRQPRPGVRAQGTGEDEFRDRGGGAVTAAHAPETARLPQVKPVRRAVDRAPEAGRVDEGLQQQQRMAEALRPVRDQAPLAQRQHPRGQVGPMPAGQDQKAAVVGQQMQPAVAHPKVPADPRVARPALQRRRGKADQRHPLAPPARRVPQRLADLGQSAQIMMRLHQAPVAPLVERRNRLDDHLAHIHAAPQRRMKTRPFYLIRAGKSRIGPNPLFRQNFSARMNSPWGDP